MDKREKVEDRGNRDKDGNLIDRDPKDMKIRALEEGNED